MHRKRYFGCHCLGLSIRLHLLSIMWICIYIYISFYGGGSAPTFLD